MPLEFALFTFSLLMVAGFKAGKRKKTEEISLAQNRKGHIKSLLFCLPEEMAFSEGNEALCGALAAVAPTIWSLP